MIRRPWKNCPLRARWTSKTAIFDRKLGGRGVVWRWLCRGRVNSVAKTERETGRAQMMRRGFTAGSRRSPYLDVMGGEEEQSLASGIPSVAGRRSRFEARAGFGNKNEQEEESKKERKRRGAGVEWLLGCVSRVLIRARMRGDGVSAPKWQGEAPARKALSRLSSRSRINKNPPSSKRGSQPKAVTRRVGTFPSLRSLCNRKAHWPQREPGTTPHHSGSEKRGLQGRALLGGAVVGRAQALQALNQW